MERSLAIWRWWIEGLVDAAERVRDRLRRRRALRLVPVVGGHVVERADGRRTRAVLRIEPGDPPRLRPERLARRLAHRDVDVVIDPAHVVTARIGPLPIDGRAYLGEIVAHRLERTTPWPAADLIHTETVEPVPTDPNQIFVAVTATSRNLTAALAAGLDALPVRDRRLVLGADGPPLDDPGRRAARREATARRIRFGVVAVGAIGLLGLLLVADHVGRLGDELTQTQATVDDYRRRLAAPRTGDDVDRLAGLVRGAPIVVLSLEKLSKTLPDGSHLSELRFASGIWSLKGISRDIAALGAAFETSPDFAAPVFTEATVREDGGDRFAIDLRETGTAGGGR